MSSQGESSDPTASAPECSREILGPTILFWMVCFAMNSMTQPTGQVLGIPYPHPAILRSSPVFCAFDAIEVLVSWFLSIFSSSRPKTAQVAATHILRRRIVDTDGNPDLHAIRALKTQWKLRWITFILGALPQFTKLFASKGIPLSQALGAMYLASWCLFELLFLAATVDEVALREPLSISIFGRHNLQQSWTLMALICNGILYTIPFSLAWLAIYSNLVDSGRNGRAAYASAYPPMFLVSHIFMWWNLFPHKYRPRMAIPVFIRTCSLCDNNIPFEFVINGSGPFSANGRITVTSITIAAVFCLSLIPGYFKNSILKGVTAADMWRIRILFSQPLIFYALIYDHAGTYQPDWLQWLG
ncbi:hypothetical protein BDW59DRAFT_87821 [Aspergillus cavernicola]|uniref:UbiA prenyltransferase family-domain-containing protein n=1 Tax=Aspergillus cavernicola TaxID=176166 RepID=A0ABR4I9A3_9EURO